ncbi:MAG: hypothetical protein ACLVB4_04125 [Butyricicoccus sp.]
MSIIRPVSIRSSPPARRSAMTFQSKGDPITDLFEDMAADGAII